MGTRAHRHLPLRPARRLRLRRRPQRRPRRDPDRQRPLGRHHGHRRHLVRPHARRSHQHAGPPARRRRRLGADHRPGHAHHVPHRRPPALLRPLPGRRQRLRPAAGLAHLAGVRGPDDVDGRQVPRPAVAQGAGRVLDPTGGAADAVQAAADLRAGSVCPGNVRADAPMRQERTRRPLRAARRLGV
ncbi:hypothetical protein SBRY_50138 [Actinacidiphila bryophytorum]|uniref:Uncharacterized protein n=1 Tax=Actinacidiphila bryophytorum TaxID=1436133 RepID=A0A9W4MCS4_9ACTN|nr:hypothetical protein SBRY_50138 [Actinacidiphila bryophytorum]